MAVVLLTAKKKIREGKSFIGIIKGRFNEPPLEKASPNRGTHFVWTFYSL